MMLFGIVLAFLPRAPKAASEPSQSVVEPRRQLTLIDQPDSLNLEDWNQHLQELQKITPMTPQIQVEIEHAKRMIEICRDGNELF
jgi:hypothetical protein